jgi:hypothetical protein
MLVHQVLTECLLLGVVGFVFFFMIGYVFIDGHESKAKAIHDIAS